MKSKRDLVSTIVVDRTFADGNQAARSAGVMPHEQLAGAAGLQHEMDFVAVMPGCFLGSSRQRGARGRSRGHLFAHQSSEQGALESQLFGVGDVLPRATTARATTFGTYAEVAAARLHTMRRCAQYLDERGGCAALASIEADANALTGKREGDCQPRSPVANDTVAVDVE